MTSPDRDILISRVVDGTALDHDWAALETLAEKQPGVWRELAQSQRQHAVLVSVVGSAVRVADETPLEIPETHVIGRISGVARWGGWAAAATIAVAWLGGINAGNNAGTGVNNASLIPGGTPTFKDPADALGAYLSLGQERGTVLGEMPAKVVLQTMPASDGSAQYDVYYVRQIVERARVDDVYRMSSDELGRSSPLPTRPRVRPASGSY